MNENTIITSEDVRKVRPVAENILDIKRIDTYIREVETLDIIPAIGALIYQQVTDPGFKDELELPEGATITTNAGKQVIIHTEDWEKLLYGDYYDNNCNGVKRYSAGLASAIAYIAYARMLPNQPLNVTAFGVVRKIDSLSEPVSDEILFRASNQARNTGLEFLSQSVAQWKAAGLIDDGKTINAKRYRKFKSIGD